MPSGQTDFFFLPKMPFSPGYDPATKQSVCNRVSGDGITQPFLPANQSLINQAAQNAGHPFPVLESKEQCRGKERQPEKLSYADSLKIGVSDPTIQE
jgi:hypothetical protein